MTRELFLRITASRLGLQSVESTPAIMVQIDGRLVAAHAGETVASVLLAEGFRAFRRTPGRHEPRGVFCGIGVCYECLVTVNDAPNTRACVTVVTPGMVIETGQVGQFEHAR